MLDVGSIIAKLVLNRDLWTQSVYEAGKDAQKLRDKISEVGEVMAGMGKKMMIAGGIVTGAMTAIGLKTLSTADNILEMSQRTGMSTKSLQELGYAAKLSGSSLEGMESHVRLMQKAVIDASRGNEQLQTTFQDLGVDLKSLVNMKPDDMFLTLSRAVAGVQSPTERARISLELFGRSGTQLLPMLDGGAAGLDAMRQAANDAGVVMDENTIKAAADLQDKVDGMQESIKGLTLTMGTLLLPMIESIAKTVTGVTQAFTGWVKEHPILGSAMAYVTAAIGGLLLAGGALLIIIPKIIAGFTAMAMSGGLWGAAVTAMMGPIGWAIAGGIALIAAVNGISKAYDKAIQEIIDSASKEGAAFREFNNYKKQASAEERQRIAEMVATKRAEGKNMQTIYTEVNSYLSQNSAEYQAWSGKASESIEVVKAKNDELKENTVQNLLDTIKAQEDARFTEKEELYAWMEEEFAAEEQRQADLTALRDQAAILEQDRWNMSKQIWQGVMDSKRQLAIKFAADERERLLIQYEYEKSLILQSGADSAAKEAAVAELEEQFRLQKQAAEDEAAKKEKERRKKSLINMVQMVHEAVQQITQTFSQYYEWQLKKLDREYGKRKEWILRNVKDEDKRAEMLKALDEELTNKKNALMRKQSIMDKASAIAGAIVNTAQAVTKALTAGPILGPILAGIIGAMGAIQIGIIASSPIPAAAEGGITTGDTLARVGDNPSGVEAIIPLEKAEDMGFGGSKTVIFNINALDSKSVEEVIMNRIAPRLQELLRNEYFQVNPSTVRSF